MNFYNKILYLLKESKSDADKTYVVNFLKSNCKPFIKNLLKVDDPGFLFSGRANSSLYFQRNVRKDRMPTDTPLQIHQALDTEFDKIFGIKARSQTIFTTPNYKYAEKYNPKVFAIFPIGNYEIIWSPKYFDLYAFIKKNPKTGAILKYAENHGGKLTDDNIEKILKEVDIKKNYKKGNLKDAIETPNEIMVYCDNYFAVRVNSLTGNDTKIFSHKELWDIVTEVGK